MKGLIERNKKLELLSLNRNVIRVKIVGKEN